MMRVVGSINPNDFTNFMIVRGGVYSGSELNGKIEYMAKYDYLIVGAGLYGAMFANKATQAGRSVLVIDKRQTRGGNIYCEDVDGIAVHSYGAHIFHTSNRVVWDFLNSLVDVVPYVNSPVANYHGKLYNMPFNMNTFYQLWGVTTPGQAKAEIDRQRAEAAIAEPRNLEEQALALVGRDIYEKLIKGYTQKQWGRQPSELPAFIIKRIPVRFTFDNNYFSDTFQGIPRGGYNGLIDRLLEGSDVMLGEDYTTDPERWSAMAGKVMYTGRIDEYFGYRFGRLEYRGLRFEHCRMDTDNYQGVAVMNFTDSQIPYTRVIEHKHFDPGNRSSHTVITREYPASQTDGSEPCYPVNDEKNNAVYKQYSSLAATLDNVRFGGRLGEYRYYDMDKIVEEVLSDDLF